MKYLVQMLYQCKNNGIFFLTGFVFIFLSGQSCNNNQPKVKAKQYDTTYFIKNEKSRAENVICWTGEINNNIPVQLSYQHIDSLIAGEIIYLSAAKRKPIQVIGNIKADSGIRLLEFEPWGSISGVMELSLLQGKLEGTWYSTKNENEFAITLIKKDTIITPKNYSYTSKDVTGKYEYAYGENGSHGSFQIKQVNENSAIISVFSVTSEPSRNIAEIERDTVQISRASFQLKNKNSQTCAYDVTVYKNFLFVKYQTPVNDCFSMYGVNADIIGLYFKTSKPIIDLND